MLHLNSMGINNIIEVTFVIFSVVAFWLLSRFSKRLKLLLKRQFFLKVFFIFISACLIGTVALYLLEHRVNGEFSSLHKTFWIVIFYILGGARGTIPLTDSGRLIMLFLLITGIGTVGTIIGKILEIIINKEVRVGEKVKGHLIVCNWNSKGENIIKELHSPLASPNMPVIVLCEERPKNEDFLRRAYPDEFSNVEFRLGNPTEVDALRYCRIEYASRILVLANEKEANPDMVSTFILLSISSIFKNINIKKPYIVVEAKDSSKVGHLKEAGASEVVCSDSFSVGLLTQSVIYPKLSQIYASLLSYSLDTNEFYMIDYNDVKAFIKNESLIKGKTFTDLMMIFMKNRTKDNPMLLVGIKKNDEMYINPKDDVLFSEDSSLIIMSYKNPSEDDIRKIFTNCNINSSR